MTPNPDFTWLFIKMIAGLVVVLGLAFILVRFVLPKTVAGRLRKSRNAPWAILIDRLPIEPKKNLYLIRIANRYFVLGSSESSVNLITELSQAEGEKIEGA